MCVRLCVCVYVCVRAYMCGQARARVRAHVRVRLRACTLIVRAGGPRHVACWSGTENDRRLFAFRPIAFFATAEGGARNGPHVRSVRERTSAACFSASAVFAASSLSAMVKR